jgi:Fe-S-cluster-containing dehydrogenase component/DMSO reductase anchor subunit
MCAAMTSLSSTATLIDTLLAEQSSLTAVERFARWHETKVDVHPTDPAYLHLIPPSPTGPGRQYAFEVDLDKCSGCKACVTACHSLNGLEDSETWRSVGLLISRTDDSDPHPATQKHVTTACHHCVDPACLNGCPVLAYEKDSTTGIVRHLDDQCMGCQYCVMKCPYEVPKYSVRLGIVRKCDMCVNRLAVGVAPACVQACPNEAIRISEVNCDELTARYRHDQAVPRFDRGDFAFLPDSPNAALTIPATRYQRKPLGLELRAADSDCPRLDKAHWPLVIMLVLTQASAGIFMLETAFGFLGIPLPPQPIGWGALLMLMAGLVAAVCHLGQPLKAWRAFFGWRKSWLSRELIAFHLFVAAAMGTLLNPNLAALAAVSGCLGILASAMVYVDTGRPFWSPRTTFGNFLGAALLLGAASTAAFLGWMGILCGTSVAQATQIAGCVSLVVRTALFVWRRMELSAALRDPQSPIHLNARAIRELLPWMDPASTSLFSLSTAFGLIAMVSSGFDLAVWASLAALTTFSSEIVSRYLFFVGSPARRMPGAAVL